MGAKELTHEEAEQLAALQERAQRIRQSQTSTTAAAEASEQSPPPDEACFSVCLGCYRTFEWISLGGVIPTPKYCVTCSAARQAKEEAAVEADSAAARERVRAERSAGILAMIARTGANATEHRNATLSTFDPSEAGRGPLLIAQDFVRDVKEAGEFDQVRGVYFWGETGTGKTHLAVGVLRALLLETDINPRDMVYDHAAELIARIQNTYSGGSTFDILERRFDAKVWILDDLGTERASEDVARHLTLIFTRRALRPTLITSNMPPEHFERRSPELARVGSRLGPAYFRIAQVTGRDRRFD